MKKEDIETLWEILTEHLSEKEILRVSNSRANAKNKYTNSESLRHAAFNTLTNPEQSAENIEKSLARWLESFINDPQLLDYDLRLISAFKDRLSAQLKKMGFYPDTIYPGTSIIITTPAEEKMAAEMDSAMVKSHLEFDKYLGEEEEKLVLSNKKMCEKNKSLIRETSVALDNYIDMISNYFKEGNTSKEEIRFQKLAFKISENLHIISTGLTNIYFGDWRSPGVPFRTLYGLNEEWQKLLNTKDRDIKGDLGSDLSRFLDGTITSREFNYFNIYQTIIPFSKKITELLILAGGPDHSESELTKLQTNQSNRIFTIKDDKVYIFDKEFTSGKESKYFNLIKYIINKYPDGGDVSMIDIKNNYANGSKKSELNIFNLLAKKGNGLLRRIKDGYLDEHNKITSQIFKRKMNNSDILIFNNTISSHRFK